MDQFPLHERPLVAKYAATPALTSRANAAASRLGKATVVASSSDIGVAHTGEINSILTPVPSREVGTQRGGGRMKNRHEPAGHWGEGVTAEEMGDYCWVRPEIVATIKFAEWTEG